MLWSGLRCGQVLVTQEAESQGDWPAVRTEGQCLVSRQDTDTHTCTHTRACAHTRTHTRTVVLSLGQPRSAAAQSFKMTERITAIVAMIS